MTRMPKWVIAVGAVALLAVLVVAAIWTSRGESTQVASVASATAKASTAPATPTPTPTPEIVLWAGDVCEARDDFVDSVVAIAASLEFDPNKPESVGEQFQSQIESQLGTIDDEAEAVGAALGAVPVDYVEAAAAISQLQGNLDKLNVAKDQALSHVSDAQAAGDPISSGLAWLRAAAAAKGAYDIGVTSVDSLKVLTASTEGDVGEAFAAAPQCG
jgi:hypothetical protein